MVGLSYFGTRHSVLKNRLSELSGFEAKAPLEVLSDPLLSSRGLDRDAFVELAQTREVFLQGKALSVGSTDPLDMNYLSVLKQLADEVRARGVGDFLAWTGVAGRHLHALMPVVYNSAMLKHLVDRVHFVQDYLGMPVTFENTLVPVNFKSNEMPENEFLGQLCDATGCGISLNLPNLFLSSKFRNYDAEKTLLELDTSWVTSIKIFPLAEGRTFPFALDQEEWDRAVWPLLSGFLRGFLKSEQTLPRLFVRDEGASASDLGAYAKWANIMMRELEHGLERTAGVVSPVSL